MAHIMHELSIESSADNIFNAVATINGLSNWWTRDTRGTVNEGGVLEIHCGKDWFNKFKVLERHDKNEFILKVIEGDENWINTDIRFKILDKGDKKYLLFTHGNWDNESEYFAKCNHYWGNYLESLKSYCETGEGNPYKYI